MHDVDGEFACTVKNLLTQEPITVTGKRWTQEIIETIFKIWQISASIFLKMKSV